MGEASWKRLGSVLGASWERLGSVLEASQGDAFLGWARAASTARTLSQITASTLWPEQRNLISPVPDVGFVRSTRENLPMSQTVLESKRYGASSRCFVSRLCASDSFVALLRARLSLWVERYIPMTSLARPFCVLSAVKYLGRCRVWSYRELCRSRVVLQQRHTRPTHTCHIRCRRSEDCAICEQLHVWSVRDVRGHSFLCEL